MMKWLVLGSIFCLAGVGLMFVDAPVAPEPEALQEVSGRLGASHFHRGLRGEAENMELEIDTVSGIVTVFAGFCTREARRLVEGRFVRAWVENDRSGPRPLLRSWQIERDGDLICPIEVSRRRASRAARDTRRLGIGLIAAGVGLSLLGLRGLGSDGPQGRIPPSAR